MTFSFSVRTSATIKIVFVLCILLLSLYLFINYISGGKGISGFYDLQSRSRSSDHKHFKLATFQIISINESSTVRKYYGDMLKFHKGKDSIGGDLFHVEGLSIDQLKVLCYQSVGCVGFTTNGHLKRVIQPYNEWIDYVEEDKTQGLFTLGIDYCKLDKGHNCPAGATCLHGLNGTYTCDSIIHIGMSIDSKVVDGLAAVLQSIIENSSNNQIIIHIITNAKDEVTVKDRVACSVALPPNIIIDYKTFDIPERLKSLITVDPVAKYLANTANYARFYLAEMFPNVSYMIYLDADLIVKKDIGLFWKEVVNTDKLLAVIPRGRRHCHLKYKLFLKLYYNRYKIKFEKGKCTGFNAGVFGVNLRMWREKNILEEIFYWMKENKENHLWRLGTQPIMYVISNENWKAIDEHWNMQLETPYSHIGLSKANIIHWSGPDKPWGSHSRVSKLNRVMRNYDYLWNKYRRDECSNNGVCTRDVDIEKSTAYCVCNDGYTGRLCNNSIS